MEYPAIKKYDRHLKEMQLWNYITWKVEIRGYRNGSCLKGYLSYLNVANS